jgi:hypothetical protein
MNLSYQLSSLYDEKSWGSDSAFRSSLYKIQNNQTSYGSFSSSDYTDYYQFSSGVGDYTIYVTGDSSNGFKKSAYSSDFSIKILDSYGNDTGLTSSSYDLYTKSISYTAKSDSTFYLEIKNNLFSDISYAATLKSDYSSTPPSNTTTTSKSINGTQGNDSLNGSAGVDMIYGFSGSDTIDGVLGMDFMYGGLGDDYYFVEDPLAYVIEKENEGTDVILTDFSQILPLNVENLFYYGKGEKSSASYIELFKQRFIKFDPKIDVFLGNDLANKMIASAEADSGAVMFSGNGGNDTLLGGSKNDILDGGEDNDVIDGGLGTNNIAEYHGNKSDYVLTKSGAAYVISGGTDGVDTLSNIQFLEFKDGTVAIDSMLKQVNRAPTGSVTISGIAQQGQTLTVSNTLADVDGLGAISYQWLNNGTAINGAPQTTYTLTQNDVGKTISVTASYTDGLGKLESVGSAGVIISNVNDLPTGSVSISGEAQQGKSLTATNTIQDADGFGVITYQWLNNGAVIPNANQSTYTLTASDVGKTISVKASYTDLQGTAESVASSPTLSIAPPSNSPPTGNVSITGETAQGKTLSIANTLADANGLGSFMYQWFRGGNVDDAINGATQSTYTLTAEDVGTKISVVVGYIDGLGKQEGMLSGETLPIVPTANHEPTGTVTVIGEAKVGAVLAISNTLKDVDGLGDFNYQWLSDGIEIDGATQKTYKPTTNDIDTIFKR